MFMETRKEKRTKRKVGDLRDTRIIELKESNTPVNDVESVVSAIFKFKDKKRRQLRLYGRGVSCTHLKHKAMMEEAKEKHDEEIQAVKMNYENKRQQDQEMFASGLQLFFTKFQQKYPDMSVDLSMFSPLLLGDQSQNDSQSGHNAIEMQPHSSTTPSRYQGLKYREEDDEEDFENEDFT